MFDFSALWLRIVWILVLCILAAALTLLLAKKLKWKYRLLIIAGLVLLFALCSINTVKGLSDPQITSFEATFEESYRVSGINPFELQYCFADGEQKHFVDLDSLSKRKLYNEPLVVGETYTVYYEKQTNLIVAIRK